MRKSLAILLCVVMLVGMMPATATAEEGCAHANAVFYDFEGIASSCFQPGVGGYWFCEDCSQYLDESKENGYWEELLASKIPATGHAFNADTGFCDNCGLANPVYTKVTSLADINEEDMYIFVAEVGGRYFVLGGLDESTADEQGNVWGHEDGNAIEVIPYEDGSISLLNQNYVGAMKPSEFMLDVNPDRWNFTEMGLTTVMPLLPNYCVFSFQSYDLHNTGYMGVPRYADGMYGMWDGGAWVIDFYTTEVDENTYRDDMDGYTHAEQVARGNIDDNIAEGDLLMYPASFYSVGGAMFTLRFREYVNEDDVTEYYFICGEDGYLVGSGEWDSVTDTIPTNDTQYAISLYRYDAPAVNTHTCDFSKWAEDEGADTHSRTCQDPECGKTETKPHNWDEGAETKAPTCTEAGVMTYTCDDCGATKTEDIAALDHDWSDWADDGANATTDTHSRTCKRDCGVAAQTEVHKWSDWAPNGVTNHIKTCSVCSGTRIDTHEWDKGVETKAPTEEEEGIMTYTCSVCTYSKTEPIAKLEHDFTFVPAVAATCEEAGNIAYYRCSHCKRNYSDEAATKELSEEDVVIAALDHDWADWSDAGEAAAEDVHKRSCKREGCEAVQTEAHQWGAWASIGGAEHEKTCSVCSGIRSAAHNWDEGTVVEPATTTQTGLTKHTCADCGATKTKVLPKVVCDHSWGEWKADDDKTHTHRCTNDNGCTAYQTQEHTWDAGVVTAEPTETAEGVKTYTCSVCGHTKEEKLAMLAHTHHFGDWISDGTDTHTRRCDNGETCTATETAAHTCNTWASNADGTHGGKCSVCGEGMTEAHSFGNWAVGTTEEQFTRSCKCGATEEMTVQKPISEAISNTTNSETNGANAELATEDAVELFNSVLTDEEQSAVAEGDVTVSVYLEVQDVPVADVSSSDKAAAEEALQENSDEEAEIGMYLDINLFKEVTKTDAATSQTETEESKITETSGKVTITITIPEELINTDAGISRTYKIVRVHEDENGNLITDVIEGKFNKNDGTFTFETDKFSTYAVAYTDVTVRNPNNPQTGDNSNLLLWATLSCISGGAALALCIYEKKRKYAAK